MKSASSAAVTKVKGPPAAVVSISKALKKVEASLPSPSAKQSKPRRTIVEVEATTPIPKTERELQFAALEQDLVTVLVPKPFTLTRDGHQPIKYPAGMQEMPRMDADHWWSKVNGVEVYVKAGPKGTVAE